MNVARDHSPFSPSSSPFATMERACVPMFNDVDETTEAAGLLARCLMLRDSVLSESEQAATIRNHHRG